MSISMRRMLKVTASTKRTPTLVEGKRGDPTTLLEDFLCTPLDPVDAEIRERFMLNTPHELLQTFADGSLDIKEGDILVVGTKEYPIRACGEWEWRGSIFRQLVVEDLKK